MNVQSDPNINLGTPMWGQMVEDIKWAKFHIGDFETVTLEAVQILNQAFIDAQITFEVETEAQYEIWVERLNEVLEHVFLTHFTFPLGIRN